MNASLDSLTFFINLCVCCPPGLLALITPLLLDCLSELMFYNTTYLVLLFVNQSKWNGENQGRCNINHASVAFVVAFKMQLTHARVLSL